MKNITTFAALAALSLALGGSARAQTFTPQITQTVGTGSSESFFTLDFQDGTVNHDYAFGYFYDGTKTGADELAALSSGTALGIGYYPGYGPTSGSSLGVAPNSFSFNGHSQVASGNNYWSYWLGTDGLNWTYSGVGASSRTLSNGSWDGWSWDVNSADAAPLTPAAAPVPETATTVSLGLLLILGAGGMALSARKKVRA